MRQDAKRMFLGVLVVLLMPATAAAATTTTTGPPPKPPAPGSAKLYLPQIFVLARDAVTVPGRPVQVDGVVHPYVAGQFVTVRAFAGGRLIRSARLPIRPSPNGLYGRFSEGVSSRVVGRLSIVATHKPTPQLGGFRASRSVSVLDERIHRGSTGRFVQLVQQRLRALHFYIPQSGVFDNGTALALDAYHRLLGWGTYETLDGRTASFLLNGWGQFQVRYSGHGRHAEGNLRKQLLALISGPNVQLIFPISSGKPSTPTILGDFHIYRRAPGYLPDGMYYSSFFIRGYAIHGYSPAPDYPASHGCMRLPIADAIPAYRWLGYGDWVDVYK